MSENSYELHGAHVLVGFTPAPYDHTRSQGRFVYINPDEVVKLKSVPDYPYPVTEITYVNGDEVKHVEVVSFLRDAKRRLAAAFAVLPPPVMTRNVMEGIQYEFEQALALGKNVCDIGFLKNVFLNAGFRTLPWEYKDQ